MFVYVLHPGGGFQIYLFNIILIIEQKWFLPYREGVRRFWEYLACFSTLLAKKRLFSTSVTFRIFHGFFSNILVAIYGKISWIILLEYFCEILNVLGNYLCICKNTPFFSAKFSGYLNNYLAQRKKMRFFYKKTFWTINIQKILLSVNSPVYLFIIVQNINANSRVLFLTSRK